MVYQPSSTNALHRNRMPSSNGIPSRNAMPVPLMAPSTGAVPQPGPASGPSSIGMPMQVNRPFGNDALPGTPMGGGGGNNRDGGHGYYWRLRHQQTRPNEAGAGGTSSNDYSFTPDSYNIPIPTGNPLTDALKKRATDAAQSTGNTFDNMLRGLPNMGRGYTEGALGAMSDRADVQQRLANERNTQAANFTMTTDFPEAHLARLGMASQAGVQGADISRRLADLMGNYELANQLRSILGTKLLT